MDNDTVVGTETDKGSAKCLSFKSYVACVADGNLPVNTVCELVHKSLSETPNELLRSV